MTDLSQIRVIVTDVDGVWTDGRVIYVGEGREIKEFNVKDGLGIKLAQRAEVEVAVVTSRRSRALERRCRELGIRKIIQGVHSKKEALDEILQALALTHAEAAYLGDDLPDLAAIAAVALSAAPSDAAAEVLAAVTWKLHSRGGNGAIREFVEKLLHERGQWETIIREFTVGTATDPSI